MLIKVTIDCVKMLTLLATFLTQYQAKLKKVEIDSLYGSQATMETDRYQFSLGQTEMTHASAQKYCLLEQTSLLTVKPELDLTALFDKFDKNTAWTSLYRLTKSPLIVDDKSVTPILQTLVGDTIKISNIDLEEVANKGITLDKNASGFTYTSTEKTELKPVICMKYAEFPYRLMDRISFKKVQTNMLNQLTQRRTAVNRVKQDIARREKVLTIFTNSSTLSYDQTSELGS